MVAVDLTPAQEESFKSAFRTRRLLIGLLAIPVAAVVLVALLELAGRSHMASRLGLGLWVLPSAALIVVLAAGTLLVWAWRCPSCRRSLAPEISPSYCRRCGIPLD